jgi:hypothetical protein
MTPEVESGWQMRAISLSTRPAEAIVVWVLGTIPYCYWVVVAVTVWYVIVAAAEDMQRQYRSGR